MVHNKSAHSLTPSDISSRWPTFILASLLVATMVAAPESAAAFNQSGWPSVSLRDIASIECTFDATNCKRPSFDISPDSFTLRRDHFQGRDGGYVYEIDYLHYPVSTGFGFKLPLGHAGVLTIDPDGSTRYFEYGRYSTSFGRVRRRRIPDVTIGPDHRPTAESVAHLYEYLSHHFGKESIVRSRYCPQASYSRVLWFAFHRMYDSHRRAYSWNPLSPNDCKTFVAEAIAAGTSLLEFTQPRRRPGPRAPGGIPLALLPDSGSDNGSDRTLESSRGQRFTTAAALSTARHNRILPNSQRYPPSIYRHSPGEDAFA